jgi:glycosyltransferase involved in cell wall biosynthesis
MSRPADVCMLLEGTYPYVRGGVSSWVHQMIDGMSELSFSLVFIGGRRSDYGPMRYEPPKNVVHLETHYLEDAFKDCKPKSMRAEPERFADARALHEYLKVMAGQQTCPMARRRELAGSTDALLATMESPRGLRVDDFLSNPSAWELIRDGHLDGDQGGSFVDYFWTLRLMHGPLFQLARIANDIPEARVFHSISTGYAGFLGALLERRRGRPLILTEHGIYTKERRIDLNQAEWFDKLQSAGEAKPGSAAQTLRELWIRFFESLGRLTYRSATPIISLYEGNRSRQHQDGADPAATRVLANGIDAQRFRSSLELRTDQVPMVVGLVGRVVPIKDVKTFIRSMRQVIGALPEAEGWVIGSADEDPTYEQECRALARSLGIEAQMRFLGHQSVSEIFPQLGVLMLTSISEAQPLAILEAFAAGVPCVATDVGACREQIDGGSAEDRALGRAGRVVPFADADALAQAAIELLSSPDTWRECQVAGLLRVERHYTLDHMLGAYQTIYRTALEC